MPAPLRRLAPLLLVAGSAAGADFPNNLTPPPLPPPSGYVFDVATVDDLQWAVSALQPGDTVMIEPGTYDLTDSLWVPQYVNDVAIRGATGNRDDVVIRGQGMFGAIQFGVWADNVSNLTVADLTISGVSSTSIILNGGVSAPLIHNVRMVDANDQFVKANPDGLGGGIGNGVVEYCVIEYTTYAPDDYTNGVDVHTGSGWVIRDNLFRNIRAAGALAGPAVLLWNHSSNMTTEANTFIDCQREISYGLQDVAGTDCSGGVIRNNFITRTSYQAGDVAIAVFDCPGTKVLFNTIVINGEYPNAVEYRFPDTTGVLIEDNLTDGGAITNRGGSATVISNLTDASAAWFADAGAGDLHLTSAATEAIGHGASVSGAPTDYDGEARPSSGADIGADQHTAAGTTGGSTTGTLTTGGSTTGGSTTGSSTTGSSTTGGSTTGGTSTGGSTTGTTGGTGTPPTTGGGGTVADHQSKRGCGDGAGLGGLAAAALALAMMLRPGRGRRG